MLKVLIADDEEMIRNGMKSFPWADYGCEIVGLAEDGQEALLMSRLLSPDIVISDIRMPGIDGLTFAKQLKTEQPHTAVVLLTGFDDTEYLRDALHLHVDEYLLKPADYQELGEALNRIRKTISVRKNRETNYQKLNQQILAALPVLRTDLFSQLINGYFDTEEEVSHSFELFDIPTGKYVVIGTRYHQENHGPVSEKVRENWMRSLSISSECQEVFSNYTTDTLVYYAQPSLYFLLIFPDRIEPSDCMNAIQLATHKIKKKLKNTLDLDLVFGISTTGQNLLDVSELYFQANTALAQCFFFQDNPTLYFADIQDTSHEPFHVPSAKRDLFTDAVRTGNRDYLEQYIEYLLTPSARDSRHDIASYTHRVISEILYALQLTYGNNLVELIQNGKNLNFIKPLLESNTREELKGHALTILSDILASRQQNSMTHYDSTAKEIIDYIKSHFQDNISLDVLAEQFHFSPAYISRLIRRSQGVNFMEILTETRMTEAKKLLSQTELRLDDIARKTGYNDTSYFILSFKKKYGVTPNEYRNMFKF